jgi:hypothetical protein
MAADHDVAMDGMHCANNQTIRGPFTHTEKSPDSLTGDRKFNAAMWLPGKSGIEFHQGLQPDRLGC